MDIKNATLTIGRNYLEELLSTALPLPGDIILHDIKLLPESRLIEVNLSSNAFDPDLCGDVNVRGPGAFVLEIEESWDSEENA